MNIIKLKASTREVGKKAARAVRRNEEVPCILYGHSVSPVAFKVAELSLNKLIYTDEFHRIAVELDGEAHDCVLKHVDFHPVSDRAMHADFQALLKGEVMTMTVPVNFEGAAKGQLEGGQVQVYMHEIEITCLPKDIPENIRIDVTDLALGDSIHVRDLEIEGVVFEVPAEQQIVSVRMPRLVSEVEEEVEELDLEGEGEEEDEDETEA